MKATQPMVHVSTDSLIVSNKETVSIRANVKMFQSGTIFLNGFAISQFLEGFESLIQSYSSVSILRNHVTLSLKLTKGIATAIQLGKAEYQFSYSEVRILKEWLEVRMHHCEQERDNRTTWPHNGAPKFNPDTYIGQKLLLLDLRELLLGEIIATEIDSWDGDNSAQQ